MTRDPTTTIDASSDEAVIDGTAAAARPVGDAKDKRSLTALPEVNLHSSLEKPGDPPVVARMVIEIRSDGSRTVARGAIEEVTSGEKIALEAHGTTPMALAANLTKSLLSAPLLAAQLFSRAAENPNRPQLFQAPKEQSHSDRGIRGSAKRAVRALLATRKKPSR